MTRFILVLFGFLVAGCQANESFIEPVRPDFANVSFDVVQKQLIVEKELPDHVENLLSLWFDQKVKIDGFDEETAKELQARAKEFLDEEEKEIASKVQELGIQEDLANHKGLTLGMLLTLGEKKNFIFE